MGEAMRYELTRDSGGLRKGDVVSRRGRINPDAVEIAVHAGATGNLRLVAPSALRPLSERTPSETPPVEIPAWELTLARPAKADRLAVPFAVAAAGFLAGLIAYVFLGIPS